MAKLPSTVDNSDPMPTPIPEPVEKKWYMSWQLWFNVGMALLFLGEELKTLNLIPSQWTIFLTIIGNLILRIFKTQTKITL